MEEKDFIAKALAKDAVGYRYLLQRYSAFAFSIAIRVTKNKEDAEEVTQDSFVKAFRALAGFKGSAKFSTWLYKIVFNTAITKIQNKQVLMDSIEQLPESSFDIEVPEAYTESFDKLVRDDQARLISKAMAALSEAEALVITLYYTCDNSVAEIEGITNWNPSTIKIRLFRARQKLYRALSTMLQSEIKDLL